MTDSSNNDMNYAILNLNPEEKRVFSYLFSQADKDQLGVVTGENAVTFFERTKISPNVLGEIWQIADTENRGLLTQPGFCMVLRLIGHYQAGREPTTELAFKQAPIPRFEGIQIPGVNAGSGIPSPTAGAFPPNVLQPQLSGQAPIRVPPLDPQKAQQYAGLFERSGTQGGQLDGATAKAIFERAGLPNDILGRIWGLSDRTQKGALDQTEFIVAMHLLTSIKTKAMLAVPNTLPQGLLEAASRRGAPATRQSSVPGVVPRQTTGTSFSAAPRTQSPLARPPGYGAPPMQSPQQTGTSWLITPADKAKFDQFFISIDTQGRGILSGEQAVTFFSDSRLPEETLAQIWDLADINSEGQLNKDEFAVAMYLIRQQRAPNPPPLPAFLPPALVPPSLRKQPQQAQSTAPAFDNAKNTSGMSKSAADDLFGLDQPSSPIRTQPATAVLQPQITGASTTRDPFGGSQPGSPVSPPRFQPPPAASSLFKPFVPTSSFGASLASQNTGGSATGAPIARNAPPPIQQSSVEDDLLGDNDTHAEESSKLTNETTELANMSNQIGNLRTQMEQTQAKKSTTQADLNAATMQKRDLEVRLQQFRAQYEQEVRTVKDLEQQLAASRESTKKLSQELAMLEGTSQDLQSQYQTVSQALQADQQENASLKQRISQINAQVAALKPDIEKLKLDARQQKGLVSINKKQLATNEAEQERLQTDKATLEQEAAEREQQERAMAAATAAAPAVERVASPAPMSNVTSPAATLNSTNPFMRMASSEEVANRSISLSSPSIGGAAPNPSAFDSIFGPSSAFAPSGQTVSRTGTPPATSFIGRSIPPTTATAMTDSIQSISTIGQPTPSATPPLSDRTRDSPQTAEPPPPPVSQQFSASHLPVGDLNKPQDSEASSTVVAPPESRAGGVDASRTETPTPVAISTMPGSFTDEPSPVLGGSSSVPGAFPTEFWQEERSTAPGSDLASTQPETTTKTHDDFDSAFAGFGDSNTSNNTAQSDPFAPSSAPPQPAQFQSEFPPIRSLESEEDEDDSEDEPERGFEDNFTASSPPRNEPSAALHSQSTTTLTTAVPGGATPANGSLDRSVEDLPPVDAQKSPPTYEQSHEPSHGGSGERTGSNQFPPEFNGLLPSRDDPTSPPPPSAEPPIHVQTNVAPEAESKPQPQSASTGSLFPSATSTDVFHDASSRPLSTVSPDQAHPPAKNAFDDFDDFDDLVESREADKTGADDVDFGFGGHQTEEFNPAFDSPTASMTNTITSSQQTPVAGSRSLHQSESSNGFTNFQPSHSTSNAFDGAVGSNSTQQVPPNAQHDWDSIFSGLDNANVDTSLSGTDDPWAGATGATGASATNGTSLTEPAQTATSLEPTAQKFVVPPTGRAITPGTEHDDPILKRLTGMGYPRQEALDALEKYDYDINKAVDHLTGS